jgi:hypothetical protein
VASGTCVHVAGVTTRSLSRDLLGRVDWKLMDGEGSGHPLILPFGFQDGVPWKVCVVRVHGLVHYGQGFESPITPPIWDPRGEESLVIHRATWARGPIRVMWHGGPTIFHLDGMIRGLAYKRATEDDAQTVVEQTRPRIAGSWSVGNQPRWRLGGNSAGRRAVDPVGVPSP